MQYQKEEIRAKIVASAISEFETAGYNKANIIRIAKNAKVPVGNLYRYFKSKDNLFEAVVINACKELPILIKNIYEKDVLLDRNEKEMADIIAYNIVEVYKKYGRQIIILADKSTGSKFEYYFKNLIDDIIKLFEKGLYGDINSEHNIMAKVIGYGFMNGLFTIIKDVPANNIEVYAKKLITYYFYQSENRI
ncbi:MAG: TetR/AcrR family transcriptional regulator [Clostridia bacterium]|jgi:AcrR family transcriptional regulator|nr:TetR/AcrR family transcriptional regulator [Clostridia bacterium]MDD4275560.1 TetR/AcrR family transcriptional regulator [Clostridia bacterium]